MRSPEKPTSEPPLSVGSRDFGRRLTTAAEEARNAGLAALLVTPGSDLRYLTGYDAVPMERLTCLVVPAVGVPLLFVPELEAPAAAAAGATDLGIELVPWAETADPFAGIARRLPTRGIVAVDNQMWAEKVLRLRDAMPGVEQALAGTVLGALRAVKSPAETAALAEAGAAIDAVHARVAEFLRVGRTEREVAGDIAAAIVDAGHVQVDFVIVASGPNGASPHHEVSDRVIESGDPVVVDIGGTMPSGYRSDSTRTYCPGTPSSDFTEYYEVLREAQAAAVASVRPGVTCEHIDAVARGLIAEAGFGQYFIHRTGHGIGLDTHEEPYIVAGNRTVLRRGHAFSIEPGIYLPGRHGARIEDIVVCQDDRAMLLNHRPRELVIVE